MLTAASTWLMPSVAMKELTPSLTTMNPDTNPTAAQATTAMIALSACGFPVFCASAVVITIENPIIKPDREVERVGDQWHEERQCEQRDDRLLGEDEADARPGQELRLGEAEHDHETGPQVQRAVLVES